MSLSPRLRLRQSQRLALTPGIRLGMRVLAMPATELAELIAAEAERNPLLLVEEPPSGPVAHGPSAFDVATETVAQADSLGTHLRRQLAQMPLPAEIAALANWLSGDLDERGFLPAPPAELAAELGSPEPQIAAAVAALQACDPPGIAAVDLADCLTRQLIAQGVPPQRAAAALPLLPRLIDGESAGAATALGAGTEEIAALAAAARRLTANPAAGFVAPGADGILRPELRVWLDPAGRPQVERLRAGLPRLRLDAGLHARARADSRARAYTESQRQAAERLIAAIGFRNDTLLAVGAALAEAQAAYFTGMEPRPAPLSRQRIAETLGLHPATVGRVVAGRALDWGGTALPMAWFFPPHASREADSPSSLAVQARIAALVRDEPPACPHSDAELAERLAQEGVDIARRTVAKYRKCLSIPSSHRRRRRLPRQSPGAASGPRR